MTTRSLLDYIRVDPCLPPGHPRSSVNQAVVDTFAEYRRSHLTRDLRRLIEALEAADDMQDALHDCLFLVEADGYRKGICTSKVLAKARLIERKSLARGSGLSAGVEA